MNIAQCSTAIVLMMACIVSVAIAQDDNKSGQELVEVLPRSGQVSPLATFRLALSPSDARPGDPVTLTIEAKIEQGWHIGSLDDGATDRVGLPTKVDFHPQGLVEVDKTYRCSKAAEEIAIGEQKLLVLDGTFTWSRQYRVQPNGAVFAGKGSIRFQACNDQVCQGPKTLEFSFRQPLPAEPSSSKPALANQEQPIGAPVVLTLESCSLTRVHPQLSFLTVLTLSRGQDELVWKAKVPLDEKTVVDLYLPKARRYVLQNRGAADTITESTATYVSVDQNGDGQIALWESCSAGRPIRIHDAMFRITAIDVAQSTLTLQKVDVPLAGSLVGRQCPTFQYTTLAGEVVTNETIRGTATILDVWAVTCHNCYEGFRLVERLQKKYSPEKLKVILLSTDGSQSLYDSESPKLFKQYGGGQWPSVRVDNGFGGILPLGDYGFGSVVVDAKGIVRAVGTHGSELEATLAEIFANQPTK